MPKDTKIFDSNSQTHVLGCVCNIEEERLKDKNEFYTLLCQDLCSALGLNLLKCQSHCFNPCGFTLIALLSESHLSFHTWPEKKVMFFDLFTCSDVNQRLLSSLILGRFMEEGQSQVSVTMESFRRKIGKNIKKIPAI